MFEPSTAWNKWQDTNDYSIKTRISDRGLLSVYCRSKIKSTINTILGVIEDYSQTMTWDPNFDQGSLIHNLGYGIELHYLRTKKIAVVSSRD